MTYNSKGARLLQSVTQHQQVVWSPETGWTDDPRTPAEELELLRSNPDAYWSWYNRTHSEDESPM